MPRSCTTADSTEEPKRRRRFSSPFRRSRSRPRSASAAFPSTTSLQSTTSLTVTPTDIPDIPKAFQGRPHSYHAPDLGMHPAYRGSADQLSATPPLHEQGRNWTQHSPMRSGFVTETEIQDDSVPPVPAIPAGIVTERRGRRSRNWGNASLMLQSAIHHSGIPTKSSRSLGASPIITQFDFQGKQKGSSLYTDTVEAPLPVPWNDEEPGKTGSPRTRHSSPITKGLWMGDTSPTLAKRTLAKGSETEDFQRRRSVVPKETDRLPAPADSPHLFDHRDEAAAEQTQDLSKRSDRRDSSASESKSQLASPTYSAKERHVPWPGTLLGITEGNKDTPDPPESRDEAPVPRHFVMQLSGDISPLLHSSKASLQEVSDDEDDMLSRAGAGIKGDEVEQRLRWETEIIGAGDVSDEEGGVQKADGKPDSHLLQSSLANKESEQHGSDTEPVDPANIEHEHDTPPKPSSPGGGSSQNVTEDRQGGHSNYETKVIGLGDVSPTSDHADISADKRLSTQALDVQSALESRTVGAGDVSPVSMRSSKSIASSSKEYQLGVHEESARPGVERFYTAGIEFDIEPAKYRTSQSRNSKVMVERPRIERFETAQEDVPGSSELTIPEIRQPASRYATVMASEPVVSYNEYTGSSSSSSDNLLEVSKPQASTGALTPQRAELAPERADGGPMPTATRRVSASQLHIVHAVEEYAASNSSLASWDQDSNAADAISEPDAAVAMKDESDLVTPVAQVPSNDSRHGQQNDQAGSSNNTSTSATSNGYFNGQTAIPANAEGQQNPAPTSNLTAPERSKSLLSIISSAVSSVAISPASSNAGRSTPSTIHRMQRDVSNARKTNLTDVQIPEEPASAKDDQTPTARNENYDLYADHNGVVKDVHDDNGQPLRIVGSPGGPPPAQLARTITGASSIGTAPDVHDSPGRRYSFERPMSFVSGSHDDDGRPQDQINQPMSGSMAAPPPRSMQRSQQYSQAPSGTIYSNFEAAQDTHWPPGEAISQQPAPPVQPIATGPVPAKVVRQPTRFVPHSQENEDDYEDSEPPAQQASIPTAKRTLPSNSQERPIANGQPPPNDHQTAHAPDSGVVQNARDQQRSVSAPLQQMMMPAQDHRIVSQPLGSPPAGPPAGPRNELEYQQQMMQLQAKYPRFRGAESQAFAQQPGSAQQESSVQEKPSSKPRLAAAIKGIVGRTSPRGSHVPTPPPPPSNLAPAVLPADANKAESFVSSVSNISREPNTSTPATQSGVDVGPQRPPSLGADSQYSHISHGSMQVQPAQSRQDLGISTVPAQYRNMHPHQQPSQQSHLAPPQPSGQSQGYRASTGAIPDSGKKKRFSAITGLFGKSNPAADLQGKFKMSREEKKAQKAQRHTSQPTLQSAPTQPWPPPNTQFIAPQQPNIVPGQGQRLSNAGNHADPRFVASQGPPQLHASGAPDMQSPHGLPHPYPQSQVQSQGQQDLPLQQPRQSSEGSAYWRTRQMAEEHRARQGAAQPPRPVYEDPASVGSGLRQTNEQPHQPSRQSAQKSPPTNGYYYPEKPSPEQGAYISTHEEQQRALQVKQLQQQQQQQQHGAQQRLNAVPQHPSEQGAYNATATARQQMAQHQRLLSSEHGAYGPTQIAHQQALQQQRGPTFEQQAYGASLEGRQRVQHGQFPLPSPEAFGRSQIHYDQIQHQSPPQRTVVPPLQERLPTTQDQHQAAMTREEYLRQAEQETARQRWQQQQLQLHQFHLQQQAQLAQQQAAGRSVSGPLSSHSSPPASPVAQRHVSSPEPQYETPPIPGAYGHVQGVFISPRDQAHAQAISHNQPGRQGSDAQMQPISPQISGQSQMPPNTRHHSDASSVSVVSPISPEPSASGPGVDQRPQKPRMPSISEVHQQAPPQERPWHMNFPAGTTEQDIVRARQKQFLQQQFASQQQAQAERHAASPSPRSSPDKQSPPFSAPIQQSQEPGGGFKEVLPRKSPQPFNALQSAPLDRRSPQHTPSHVQGMAGWPQNASPSHSGPASTVSAPRPSSQEPHTPVYSRENDRRPTHIREPEHTAHDDGRFEPTPPNETQNLPTAPQQPQYDDNVPDDAPPSYDGPGVPYGGMEKSNPDRPRPPNIITAPEERGRQQEGRPRQSSLGLMQHPQPASMAASPQRTAPHMGAESLRRQMLQQEEHARMERIQRSQMQAAQRQREQQEREAARARALELERSVSGGGRVGSLRSVSGSQTGGARGWERRGLQGSNSRPVFELPALEDEEPVMRATSFPGQEWVPPMFVDD